MGDGWDVEISSKRKPLLDFKKGMAKLCFIKMILVALWRVEKNIWES